MQGQNSPFLFSKKAILKDISNKIDHKKRHDQFKPPGVIDPNFGRVSRIPRFYKGTQAHGGGENNKKE